MTSLAFVANATDGTVSTFALDPDGRLERVAVSQVGDGCATMVIDAVRRQVHVGIKDPASIVTCRIEADGSLTTISSRNVAAAVHYLALRPDGNTMVAASYGGGFGISMPVDDEGVGPVVSRIDQPNMHACAIGPEGLTAYLVSLGADLIVQCSLDGHALVPLDPPTVAAPDGSGPRHVVLSRNGAHLYVLTEFSGEVLHYIRAADGTLTPAGQAAAFHPGRGLRHSRFGADPMAEHLIWGADLHLSVDERICWASERTESTLATVPIDTDGIPHDASLFTDTEPQPRGFAVSPDGRYLLSAGERSISVSLFEIQPDGELTLRTQVESGRGANWIRFLAG